MSRRSIRVLVTGLACALAVVLASVAFAAHDGYLKTQLTGEAVVPGTGDPDATGLGFITFDEGEDTICHLVGWRKMQRARSSHIHRGNKGELGERVMTLFAGGRIDSRRSSEGCKAVAHSLWKDIQEHPARYYIDVHNTQYPKGAVRGQLHDDS